MKIAMVGGSGYVGLCTGVGLAGKGHVVVCIDQDQAKVAMLQAGKSPLYEPGLEAALKAAIGQGRLTATSDIDKGVAGCQAIFITVGTPSNADGSIDLSYIKAASAQIGAAVRGRKDYFVVIVKSTVVPETTEKVVRPALEQASGKVAGKGFGLVMNPEFLREGKALDDFLMPDRIVIGSLDQRSGDVAEQIYHNFQAPKLRTDLKTAEMIKYAGNAMLATKISFINEIGNICKLLGIDAYKVAEGIGLDKRIGPHFLNSGIGWGGSCFPKDVAALVAKAKEIGYEPRLLDEVTALNARQKVRILDMLERRMGSVKGKRIAVLGLAFKNDTDDIRDAPSIEIIGALKKAGATIAAYDPQAMGNMRKLHPDITYAKSVTAALEAADACLVLTEWKEFAALGNRDFAAMRSRIILEGRRVLADSISGREGVCW